LKMVGFFFKKKIPKLALRIFFKKKKRQNAIAWRFGF